MQFFKLWFLLFWPFFCFKEQSFKNPFLIYDAYRKLVFYIGSSPLLQRWARPISWPVWCAAWLPVPVTLLHLPPPALLHWLSQYSAQRWVGTVGIYIFRLPVLYLTSSLVQLLFTYDERSWHAGCSRQAQLKSSSRFFFDRSRPWFIRSKFLKYIHTSRYIISLKIITSN